MTAATLGLVHLFPGGPIRALLGSRATPQLVEYYNHLYGFDQPFYVTMAYDLDHHAVLSNGIFVDANSTVTAAVYNGGNTPGLAGSGFSC